MLTGSVDSTIGISIISEWSEVARSRERRSETSKGEEEFAPDTSKSRLAFKHSLQQFHSTRRRCHIHRTTSQSTHVPPLLDRLRLTSFARMPPIKDSARPATALLLTVYTLRELIPVLLHSLK